VNRDANRDEWDTIAIVLGKSLRMTGDHLEALTHLREAIESKGLTAAEQASAWVNVALAEEARKNIPAALEAVDAALRIAK